MAERVTVKSLSIKKGENDNGEWVNTRITATTGAKWSGFDKALQYLKEGETIEITEYEEKGQNRNIIKWHKVEGGVASPPDSGNGKPGYGKTPEQFDAERRSIEAQTAYNGIISLIEQEALQKVDFVPGDLKDLAYDWARGRLSGTIPKAAKPVKTGPEQSEAAEPETKSNGFQNAGQFLTKCKEIWGLDRSHVLDIPGVKELFDAGQLEKAYLKVTERMTKN